MTIVSDQPCPASKPILALRGRKLCRIWLGKAVGSTANLAEDAPKQQSGFREACRAVKNCSVSSALPDAVFKLVRISGWRQGMPSALLPAVLKQSHRPSLMKRRFCAGAGLPPGALQYERRGLDGAFEGEDPSRQQPQELVNEGAQSGVFLSDEADVHELVGVDGH